jgi:hypothetical protein
MQYNKTYLYISISVLLFLVVLGWYFYRQGKKGAQGPKVYIPQGTNSIPMGWNAVALADELKDVMTGLFTMSGTKDKAWRKLAELPTDDMVKAVYSAFNQKYFADGKGTLTQWIRDEKYYDYLSGIRNLALTRLAQLGLA